MSPNIGLSRRVKLALAASTWLATCDAPSPPDSEFWRPWYDVADASAPDDLAAPSPDLAAPVDASTGGPADLSSMPGTPDLSSMRDLGSVPDLGSMPDVCSLAVTVTTVSPGGKYSPRNIGAIWISDASDRFIKTLNVWADRRAKYLKRWNAATTAASLPADRTDAISSATKSSHSVRTGTWNCKNTASVPVSDGAYKVCFELTDYDGDGPYDCVSFTKGVVPFTLTPADAPSFTARKLELTR